MRLDKKKVDELRARVEQEVEERGLASCQYALGLDGEVLVAETVGDAPPDARYVIFSSTKILAVAVIWQMLGDGSLNADLPVTTWWPEFGKHGKDAITLSHVLSHSAGVPGGAVGPELYEDRQRRAEHIADWQLQWEPGSRFEYHGTSAHWILAELIARVTGVDHRQAIRERLLDPLGLSRLELGVPLEHQGDIQPIVPTGDHATWEEIAAELGPELAARVEPFVKPMLTAVIDPMATPALGGFLTPEGLAAGVPGANAVSDAASVALLYQALLHNTKDLWNDDVLRYARQTPINRHPTFSGEPVMRGLGVEISGEGEPHERRRRICSGFTSPSAFGHNGAGGQTGWADPESGLSFAFLTNGWDRNAVHMARRERAMNEYAARCVVD
jgi:CubicO group peptidase (beta-lactamase class C family)